MLVWKCCGCKAQLTAAESETGKLLTCSHCGTVNTVPKESSPDVGSPQSAPPPPPPPPPPIPPTAPQAATTPPPISPPFSTSVDPFNSQGAACSRLVYIVLGIFLGKLGIHNFVAGYTNKAILQLCISLAGFILAFCTVGVTLLAVFAMWVWAIIDIATVTHDAKGRRMP